MGKEHFRISIDVDVVCFQFLRYLIFRKGARFQGNPFHRFASPLHFGLGFSAIITNFCRNGYQNLRNSPVTPGNITKNSPGRILPGL